MTTAIVSAGARGILMKVSRSMLSEYGGPATLTKAWAQSLLQCMGFVKRRGTTTKFKISVENFESLRDVYFDNISTMWLWRIFPLTWC